VERNVTTEYDYVEKVHDDNGVSGSGEELQNTLTKVVSQLDLITRTLHVLEQRVSMNEESTTSVMDYFREAKNH
jgi:hypothetical protein